MVLLNCIKSRKQKIRSANATDIKKKKKKIRFKLMVVFPPFQWTNGTNAGFTDDSEGPWLPLTDDYEIYNVETQNDTYLALFRNITNLRQMTAFQEGDIYFPYHDDDIFSFLRYVSTLRNKKQKLASFIQYFHNTQCRKTRNLPSLEDLFL